jgi:hypothetical protein
MNSESINPWGEFRKRFGACQKVTALGLFSCLMLFSPTLYNVWTVIAIVLSSLLIFFAVRVALLPCPRCQRLFYWPPRRLTQRIGRCVHCNLWKYDPYNVDGLSERHFVARDA